MYNRLCLILLIALLTASVPVEADTGQSTRVVNAGQHAYSGTGRYPYRAKSTYVLSELDLKPGDVVVDIGAGDGWWSAQMARSVGATGVIHAAEVAQSSVDRMKARFQDLAQIRPYLCPTDGTGLPENSCDLAFLSKTYHHLSEGGHVDYLRHLRKVVRPMGRVCIIERHPTLGSGRASAHAWSPSLLIQQAEEAGWILVRYELITGTFHYMAVFVQKELFVSERQRRG